MLPLIIISSIVGAMLITYCIFVWVERSSNIEFNRGRQNYKVRYNAVNRKYYITNASHFGDIDVVRFGFFRVYYKSKIDADFVMQKLNDPS